MNIIQYKRICVWKYLSFSCFVVLKSKNDVAVVRTNFSFVVAPSRSPGHRPAPHDSLVLISLCISVARYIIIFVMHKLRIFYVHLPNFHLNLSTWRCACGRSVHTPHPDDLGAWCGQKHRIWRHWPESDIKRIYYIIIDHVKHIIYTSLHI